MSHKIFESMSLFNLCAPKISSLCKFVICIGSGLIIALVPSISRFLKIERNGNVDADVDVDVDIYVHVPFDCDIDVEVCNYINAEWTYALLVWVHYAF